MSEWLRLIGQQRYVGHWKRHCVDDAALICVPEAPEYGVAMEAPPSSSSWGSGQWRIVVLLWMSYRKSPAGERLALAMHLRLTARARPGRRGLGLSNRRSRLWLMSVS